MPDRLVDTEEEISLRPYFDAVWRFRRIIGASVVAAAALFALGTVWLYLKSPVERVASLQFRLLFAGAEDQKYPSGQPFNPTEVVSPPVIAEVFQANNLSEYGKLQDFQQALFLTQSNPALQQLDYQYQSRLSDTRLTPVERAQVEDEFLRKREAIRIPEYALSMRRVERFRTLPAELMEKILKDTLEAWARQADQHKGAARPDLDIVSRDVFARASNELDSLFVRIDVLRSGARRLLASLSALERVPGARAVRTDAKRSLADEKAVLEDIIRFDIEPLMSLARTNASTVTERPILLAYVSNQIVTHKLNLREAQQRAMVAQTSLREYMAQRGSRVDTAIPPGTAPPQAGTTPAIVPQLGEAFVDRLLEMAAASQGPELEFRQELTDKYIRAAEAAALHEREVSYYEDLQRQIQAPVSTAVSGEALDKRFKSTHESLLQAVDRVQAVYEAVSIQTLNPSRRLYTITQPFRVTTTSSLIWNRLVLFFVLTLCLVAIAATAACLLYYGYRVQLEAHRPSPRPPAIL